MTPSVSKAMTILCLMVRFSFAAAMPVRSRPHPAAVRAAEAGETAFEHARDLLALPLVERLGDLLQRLDERDAELRERSGASCR